MDSTAGEELADTLSTWAEPVRDQRRGLDANRKTDAMTLLMDPIEELERADLISRTRMCRTCRFSGDNAHKDAAEPHHCNLLDLPLSPADLRVDCPEHEPTSEADDSA